jgi:hypothetical protein
MGFHGLSLVIAIILEACRPKTIGEAMAAGAFTHVIFDLSMQLHRNHFTREAVIAVLLAFLEPSRANVAAAMRLALFSKKGAVGQVLTHLRRTEGVLPAVWFISERGSQLYVPLSCVVFFSCFRPFVSLFFPLVQFRAKKNGWRETSRRRRNRKRAGSISSVHCTRGLQLRTATVSQQTAYTCSVCVLF